MSGKFVVVAARGRKGKGSSSLVLGLNLRGISGTNIILEAFLTNNNSGEEETRFSTPVPLGQGITIDDVIAECWRAAGYGVEAESEKPKK